ncbi:hypothetical protein BGI33_06480 [Snodgrassella alvi]|nr:hypothetical protein BGI33_06480 [Snodgrassella alvi]PIT21235.1 hypothetical protein BGI34_01630 [Snodgrassella alvi]
MNLTDGESSEVMDLLFDKQYSPARAWREYLQLTQKECAKKLSKIQPAYSPLESSKRPRKATTIKLATALSIHKSQPNLLA